MGYLTGVRAAVTALLADALPDVDVYAWPDAPDQPLRPTVVVATTGVRPPNTAVPAVVAQLDLWVVPALTTDAASEDALDALLDDVLTVLDGAGIAWTTADRAVFRDTHPAYRIEMESIG